MKAVVQRVTHAGVTVTEENYRAEIKNGLLVLLGIGEGDDEEAASRLASKICKLRIFSDENDKINLSVNDINGSLLVISQFTLYADCKKGNRPNFINAAKPDTAKHLYDYFTDECKKLVPDVKKGIFGADMKVDLLNDGPFTVILEDI